MANKIKTVFQNLDSALSGNWDNLERKHNNSYDLSSSSDNVIYSTTDKQDYERTKLEYQQNAYLDQRWRRANTDLSVKAFNGLNNVKLMYRDADLMDAYPEIGAALDIVSEEACVLGSSNSVVNVYSKSNRIKNVLEDLFTNRLDLQVTAPMIIRAMCKYGNQFMLLNIDNKLGVKGWRQLPVFNVERLENGVTNQYGVNSIDMGDADMSTKFVWLDENNSQVPFRNWQIGHFRLLTDSIYLPYGCSYLHKARRHWRMLSLMEDMMLIYRLERSIERRVYKIYVGAIDDADVGAYIEEIANNFKRTPIIDPLTGQVDLRKNILPVRKDTPIPLLDGRTITIEELAKEFNEGKENYVYSIQDKTLQVCPGKVVWCGKNYTADKLVKITLDDDTYTVMASEHEVIMRDGSKKRADELKPNDSVMPFYRVCDKNSENFYEQYEKVYNPRSGKYERTHRFVAKHLLKSNEKYNTVHHIDFNKYNNNPTNLLWCDYHEHHKMHGELAKQIWSDPIRRQRIIEKLSASAQGRVMDEETKDKISNTLKNKYENGELDFIKEINKKRIVEYNSLESTKEMRREVGIKMGYRKDFREYNESELHKEHDEIRRKNGIERWQDESKRTEYVKNMTVQFDDFMWDSLRKEILSKNIYNRKTLLEYINNNLIGYLKSINNNKRLHNNNFISREVLEHQVKTIGFNTITEYIESIKKNHKIKSIEIIDGDDVYCMTVVGLNGEEDRHNFAIRSFNEDGSWCENGIFVSNCIDQDIFIPVRNENAPTPIDTLSAAQNLTAMDDIKFVQNKVLTGLRIPKSFLNFEEATGDGKNLALMDIRFTRTVNRIQQAFLMELTKIATIHLYLMGFEDDLTNFSLSMNNPSTQAEQLEIDNIQKKIGAIRDAVADPGNGIPIMSQQRALKEILKWSEKDIKDNLEEIRLEKAIAAELEKTTQIIKKTGVFDSVDLIYGEPGAEYQDDAQGDQQGGDEMGGMPGGGGGGMPPMDDGGVDGEIDALGGIGEEGAEGSIDGAEGEIPMDGGNEQPMESIRFKNKPLLTEGSSIKKADMRNQITMERIQLYDKALIINEEFDNMLKSLMDIKK